MKPVINEKFLRKFIRYQIKKKNYNMLVEQSPINVEQGIAATYEPLEFGKCEIEIPPAFKDFVEKLRVGNTEAIKIEYYKRALKLGIDISPGSDHLKQLATNVGVSDWRLIPYVGPKIGNLPDVDATIETGKSGARYVTDKAGNVVRKGAELGIMAVTPGPPAVKQAAAAAGAPQIEQRFEQTIGGWISSVNPRQEVEVLLPDGSTTNVRVPADIGWNNFETKKREQFLSIMVIIENLVFFASQILNYAGFPSIFCTALSKGIEYFSKFANYFYSPQEATGIQSISRQVSSNASRGGAGQVASIGGFNIAEEVRRAEESAKRGIGNSIVDKAFSLFSGSRNNSGIYSIFYPGAIKILGDNFDKDAGVWNTNLNSKCSELERAFDEDLIGIRAGGLFFGGYSIIDLLTTGATEPAKATNEETYQFFIDHFGLKNLLSSKATVLANPSLTPDDVKAVIFETYKNLALDSIKAMLDYNQQVNSPFSGLGCQSQIERILDDQKNIIESI